MSAQDIMKKKGKTFYFATRFLPKNEPEDISILYAFCRYVDDLVDLHGGSSEPILDDLKRGISGVKEVQNLLKMAQIRNISLEPAKILVATLQKDRKGKRIQTWGELLHYCYGVASTVGLMMCDIFQVKEKEAHPFAIDLGIAMQLTNIARDILEDAEGDRIYLPREAFQENITPEEIIHGKREDDLLRVQEEILKLADRYYKSADQGIHFLPKHARLTILVASRLYQAKGRTIRKNRPYYLQHRADVPLFGKLFHTTRALFSFWIDPSIRSKKKRLHESVLHRDLFLLPGTNPPLH